MDETGISKAEQVMLLKGLIEEGVRQKREMVFKHREAQEEMLRYGLLFCVLLCVGLVSILRDSLVIGAIKKQSASMFMTGGLIGIFLSLLGLLEIFFAVKCIYAFTKYANPIVMKDGTELPYREAAAAIDSSTKRNFRKLIEIRQSMTPAEMDATRIEPYRFDTLSGGYYAEGAKGTVPQIEKAKEEVNEKRKVYVQDLEEIQIHRTTNRQMMIGALVVAVVSRIMDVPFAKYFPPAVWKAWMVLSYLLFFGGVALTVFYGIRYLYEKRDNRLLPSLTLIDRDENMIENFNYLLTDLEFMAVIAQRRKDPAWNKPVIETAEARTISMMELTEAVAEANASTEFRESAGVQAEEKPVKKDDPYDLSYGRAEASVETIDLMPSFGVQDRVETAKPVEPVEKAIEPAVEPVTASVDTATPSEETAEKETASDEQKKLEEYMRDLKRKAQDEADFSEELLNEMERIRKTPEAEVFVEKEEAPKHPASSNLFYYPTATTREQTPFEDQAEPGSTYINHSTHTTGEMHEGEEGEPAPFRHRTGGEKDKYSYDGRPKKASTLRRVQMSSDQDPVEQVEFEEPTPIRPAAEEPKVEEKKATLRMNEEFQSSMTEHMRSLQEDFVKKEEPDRSAKRMAAAPLAEGTRFRMDREQGLTISLEDALKDLESFDDEDR
ncbi:MAG: hypothetical protein J5757_04700 [Lachnospiraceae bacterium]|nr:hypothetical protein [Lachnospiraceae bacterium]